MNIVNDKMSDTPETDAQGCGLSLTLVTTEFARKLERERDDLQKAVNGLCKHFKVSPANTTLLAVEVLKIERERNEAITRRMETIMQCELYEQERDEARAQFKELIYIAERAIDLAEIDFENDKFGVVSELRDGLEKIKEETK